MTDLHEEPRRSAMPITLPWYDEERPVLGAFFVTTGLLLFSPRRLRAAAYGHELVSNQGLVAGWAALASVPVFLYAVLSNVRPSAFEAIEVASFARSLLEPLILQSPLVHLQASFSRPLVAMMLVGLLMSSVVWDGLLLRAFGLRSLVVEIERVSVLAQVHVLWVGACTLLPLALSMRGVQGLPWWAARMPAAGLVLFVTLQIVWRYVAFENLDMRRSTAAALAAATPNALLLVILLAGKWSLWSLLALLIA